MCKALIIGAGGVGTVVAQKIAANPIFTEVTLASRTKSKCDAIAEAIFCRLTSCRLTRVFHEPIAHYN